MIRKNIDFGSVSNVNKENKLSHHTPSSIQADTLFTFTSELEYLLPYIKNLCVYPRYCDEDIRYLKIKGLKKIYIPMKCFCDINLHRLDCHLDWYGYYGLAFSKEWGMAHKIQPIQYINPDSELRKDFSSVFSKSINDSSSDNKLNNMMKDFLLHELMYYKPYQGKIKNRNTKTLKLKCFADECEWRFIPDLSKTDFQQVYTDSDLLNAGIINEISNSLSKLPNIGLKYVYSDIKYIIVKTQEDFEKLITVVKQLDVDEITKYELISKTIVWDKAKGDF